MAVDTRDDWNTQCFQRSKMSLDLLHLVKNRYGVVCSGVDDLREIGSSEERRFG